MSASDSNFVKKVVKKWQVKLRLEDWIINIHVHDKYFPGDKSCEASIVADLKYKEAELEVWKPFAEFDERHKEINIVHELCHLILWRINQHVSPSGDDLLEEVVQTLAMTFFLNG